ncbi:MAG: response regulator [Gemmatimonadetes bacterium]|nr:response regulator [Gemmatimonadota bacterium]
MRSIDVLIVEDNPDNRDIYCTFLRHHGLTVLEAVDGAEGVRMAMEHLPGVVLMDVGLPVLDGLEATRRIKAHPATAAIPVLALTAHAMESDRRACADAGCDAFLAKPAEPSRVLEMVRALLPAPLP